MDVVTSASMPAAVREFTDREEPRAAFWKKLSVVREAHARQEKKVHVLAYYGVGGIGKSTLLKKLQEEMKKEDAAAFYAAWDFKDNKESRVVLERLKNKLEDQFKIPFPLFDYAHYVYARKLGEKPDSPKVKSIIGESSFLSWCMSALDPIPVVGLASKLLQLADQGVAMVREHLKKHSTTVYKIESMEANDLYKELPKLFAADLAAYMEKSQKPLVIFLDTYESLVNELLPGEPLNHDLWLRDNKTGLLLRVPYVLWVIAGREKLKWERFYEDWNKGLEQHLLGDLSETDSVHFLETAGVTDAKLRGELYRLTGGTPMYLDLCVTQYENILAKGETPAIELFGAGTEEFLHRFLTYMDGAQKDIMYILACVERWNDTIIFEIAKKSGLSFNVSDYELIKSMSFVLSGDKGGYCLHQTVGDVLRQKAPKYIKEQVAQGLRETYQETVPIEEAPLSETHTDALAATLREGMLTCEEDEALRLFYREHLCDSIKELAEIGQFERAIGLMEEMLARAAKNEKSRLHAEVLCDFAWIKRLAGQYTEAKALAEESLQLYTELLGEDDLATIRAMSTLGSVLEDLGAFDKAKALQEEVLEKRKRLLGENHPDTLTAMSNLALTLGDLGAYEAKALYEEVLEQRKRLSGENHPNTLIAMNNLASTLYAMGAYEEAIALQEEVLEKMKPVLGENHPDTLSAMNNLASTLGKLGAYEEAKALQEEVLEKSKLVLGENHPDTLTAMNNLASTLGDMGVFDKAKALKEEVLEKMKLVLGENHPNTLIAMNNLANTLGDLGAYEEAKALQEEVLEKRKRILGADHPDTLRAMNNLAVTLGDMGAFDKAKVLQEEALEKSKQVLGEDHPSTICVAQNLMICLKRMGVFRNRKKIRELKTWLKKRK